MICIMQIRVDGQVSILDAIVPTMCSLANIGTWIDSFFHAAAKSTLPFAPADHCQAQPGQSPFSLTGLKVCTEFIQGGEV
jgi:hypothetical protein